MKDKKELNEMIEQAKEALFKIQINLIKKEIELKKKKAKKK